MSAFDDDDEREYEEPTDEERVRIAQHFLLNAPPGQFADVLRDVQSLVPAGCLSEAQLGGICRAYNTKTARRLEVEEGGAAVLLVPEGEVGGDAGRYLDPAGRRSVAVDHAAFKATGTEEAAAAEGDDADRAAIEAALRDYAGRQYAGPTTAAAYAAPAGGGGVVAYVSGERCSLRNFWSGSWVSRWEVAGGRIKGSVTVRAHYFEDGNVQLQTKKACANTSIPKGSAGDVASAVQSHIATEEKVVQEGLEEM